LYYVQQNNQRIYAGGTTTNVQKSTPATTPSGKLAISVTNQNTQTGHFDVVVTNVSSGVREVKIPVWPAGKGDSLVWYSATPQGNGSYKVHVDPSRHNNHTGKYYIDLYYVQQNNQRIYAGGTTTNVQKSTPATTPSGKLAISVTNQNTQTGHFDVVVTNVSSGVREVKIPVWPAGKGDSLVWYSATPQGNGSYKVHVDPSRHNNHTGKYYIDLYYVQQNNQRIYAGGTTTNVQNDGKLVGVGGTKTAVSLNQAPASKPQRTATSTDAKSRVIEAAASMVGVRHGSAQHRALVDDYNSVKPLPVGYSVKYSDDWCDVFVTTVFQRQGLSHLIGRECGVERHIQIFKRLGIWNEDGRITPKAGDLITFNWDQNHQQNDGFADHIGIVEKVENGFIHTIEGNSGDAQVVARRTYRIGDGNIRGFASPRY
ncbi:GBS Bsp-like repeat-containing protein, partial [Streptococcus himalayensis]